MKILFLLIFVGCAAAPSTSLVGSKTTTATKNESTLTPNEAGYWIQLGINAREKKDFTPSFYAFNRGLGLGKTDQEKILAHQGLALLLLEFSNVEEAKQHYDKVFELGKKNKEINLKSFAQEYEQITTNLTAKSQS